MHVEPMAQEDPLKLESVSKNREEKTEKEKKTEENGENISRQLKILAKQQ